MARLAISKAFVGFVLALCTAFVPTMAAAEDAPLSNRVEFTLFGGYRFGGGSAFKESIPVTVGSTTTDALVDVDLGKGASYGLALNWEADVDSFFELSYSTQSSTLEASTPIDVSAEYLQIGGYVLVGSTTDRVVPYFLLTIGGGRLVPDDPDLREVTKFAMAIGGGAKITFTEHLGMRIDGRLYGLFLGGDQNIFCASSNGIGCKVHLEGDMVVQPEVSLGFTYGF